MIKSAYFPDTARCFAESTGNKVELPADIYDAAVAQGTVANDLILRGDFTYETAKIFAQSGYVDALEFDKTSGEIKTSGVASVSAEINFALAVWNGYSREAAIERAILAQLSKNTNLLPEILADKVSQIKINDITNSGKNFAKATTKKFANYFGGKIQDEKIIDGEISVNISTFSQVARRVGNFFSQHLDEIFLIMRHYDDVKDLVTGRISGKQFVKNTVLTMVVVMGAAVSVSFLPAMGPITLFLVTYEGKIMYKKKVKRFLDLFVDDDRKKMLKILDGELAKLLDGKFLTEYEVEILLEALGDKLNQDSLKEMFASGNDTAQTKWAQNFLSTHFGKIFAEGFRQRSFVEKPMPDEWHAGLRRVLKTIEAGEDIVENMKRQRAEALAKRKKFFEDFGLKLYETAEIVQTVNDTAKTQLAAERTLGRIQADNRRYETKHQQQLDERAALKNLLNGRR